MGSQASGSGVVVAAERRRLQRPFQGVPLALRQRHLIQNSLHGHMRVRALP